MFWGGCAGRFGKETCATERERVNSGVLFVQSLVMTDALTA